MSQESIVYGCIKGAKGHTVEDVQQFNRINQAVLQALPVLDDWPAINRNMFSVVRQASATEIASTDLIHFGYSYAGIEYEWKAWLKKFEQLLQQMVWQSVVVHLDTELSGLHTFLWETDGNTHQPNANNFNIRCEWNHELAS